MVSSYTTRKRLEKQNPGENSGTWGGYLNSNTIDLLDECFGIVCVAMTTAGDSTLSTQNGSTDEGRRSQIILTGTPTSNVSLFVPATQSYYFVRNKMAGNKKVTIKNTGGTNGVDFSGSGSGAEQGVVISDGTNVREVARTVSISGFNTFTSAVMTVVSDAATDTTGGQPADWLNFLDASDSGALNKVRVSTFFNNFLPNTTEETAVAVSDSFLLYDLSSTTAKVATTQNLFKGFNGLTEETTPTVTSDYLLAYNTSVGVPRKVLMQTAVKGVNVGTKTTDYTVTTSDRNGSVTFSGMSADANLFLPAAATFGIGNIFWFSHEDTGINPAYAVTVDGNASETIDGATTRKAWSGTRVGLMAISGGWKTICGEWVVISTQQTIVAGDDATFSHGQPTTPTRVEAFLICLTAEGGYSVGDRIQIESSNQGSASTLGISWGGNSTTLFYVIGSGGCTRGFNKTTGAQFALTTSNWALVLTGTF